MAVEKMSLISVSGPLKKVNKTLVRCCETKCFHIEPSFYTMTYGSAHFKTLKDKDIYGGLMKRADVLSVGLGIKNKTVSYDDIQMEAIHDFDMYFTELEQRVMPVIEQKNELEKSIDEYSHVLRQVGNLSNLNVDFKDLFSCKHVKIRFGKLRRKAIRSSISTAKKALCLSLLKKRTVMSGVFISLRWKKAYR